jgi:hypothetical protein
MNHCLGRVEIMRIHRVDQPDEELARLVSH